MTGRPMTPEAALAWLKEAERYFENRPTKGEDRAHWSNVYNAMNCRRIAALIRGLEDADAGLTRAKVIHRARWAR